MHHISDLNYHQGISLTESAHVSVHTYYTLPPNKHFICITTFIFVRIFSLQGQRARALSLATGLVARIQHSCCHDLTSVSGREPKHCFKLLQAKAT